MTKRYEQQNVNDSLDQNAVSAKLLEAKSNHTIKTLILGGFFVCAISAIFFGGCKYLKTDSQESEREAVGLIANIMAGITGIAAGVFTSGNLR